MLVKTSFFKKNDDSEEETMGFDDEEITK